MKILFDSVNFNARSGPNTFALRLARALYMRGHTLADPSENYDVMLSFIEPSREHKRGSMLVQRLDGIWFKPEQFVTHNRGIKACYERADLVVWQSEFDKNMTQHHWDQPRSGTVIRNGIDMTPCDSITIPGLQQLRNNHKMMFVCSSNWHPQKRLRDNVDLFLHLKDNFYKDAVLLILGSNPDAILPKQDVYYLGQQPQDVFIQVFAASNWMLHLAWLDHCPNVVVESLSQGTPVICTDTGGTKELVQEHGIILREEPYEFGLVYYDDPPRVAVDQITEPLPDRKMLGKHADINIDTVAQEYEAALTQLLETR